VSGSKISQKKIDAMKKRVYDSAMGDNQKGKKLCGDCKTFKACYRDEKFREGFDLKAMPGCVNWKKNDSGNGANQ
jgi:hypothetical protein